MDSRDLYQLYTESATGGTFNVECDLTGNLSPEKDRPLATLQNVPPSSFSASAMANQLTGTFARPSTATYACQRRTGSAVLGIRVTAISVGALH